MFHFFPHSGRLCLCVCFVVDFFFFIAYMLHTDKREQYTHACTTYTHTWNIFLVSLPVSISLICAFISLLLLSFHLIHFCFGFQFCSHVDHFDREIVFKVRIINSCVDWMILFLLRLVHSLSFASSMYLFITCSVFTVVLNEFCVCLFWWFFSALNNRNLLFPCRKNSKLRKLVSRAALSNPPKW